MRIVRTRPYPSSCRFSYSYCFSFDFEWKDSRVCGTLFWKLFLFWVKPILKLFRVDENFYNSVRVPFECSKLKRFQNIAFYCIAGNTKLYVYNSETRSFSFSIRTSSSISIDNGRPKVPPAHYTSINYCLLIIICVVYLRQPRVILLTTIVCNCRFRRQSFGGKLGAPNSFPTKHPKYIKLIIKNSHLSKSRLITLLNCFWIQN